MLSGRRLHLITVSAAGYATHRLTVGTTVVIGRSHTNDIVIDDASISRCHARLAVSAQGTVTITDLESANGITVGGRLLPPNRPTSLRLGEAASLGKAVLIVQANTGSSPRREVLGRDAFFARLEERCRDAHENGLPFRIASISSTAELTETDVLTSIAPLLGSADVIGTGERHQWVLVLDDVPDGRAKTLVHRVSDVLRADEVRATIGIARWPQDGRTATTLLAAASGTAQRSQGRPEIVIGARVEALFQDVERIARSDLSVLVLGETGVGKEIIASRLHERSPRAGRPMMKINCSALAPELLESELFGHVRGAFTGATHDKPGLLSATDGGTVFLDEIADLPPPMQAKLLRVIEDREVRPIGAIASHAIDVRFVAATNRPLDDPAQFRPDLFFRLSGAVIEVPPLRERTDEILPLARLFLREYAHRYRTQPPTLSAASEQVLRTYSWPGNIRELKNLIERAAIVCDGLEIEPRDFPITEMRVAARLSGPIRVPGVSDGPTEVPSSTKQPDRAAIVAALAEHGGNQGLAAQRLGIHRRTLMRWMDLMNIARPRKG